MFIHCKNIEALHYCLEKNDNLEFFFHDSDDCAFYNLLIENNWHVFTYMYCIML